MPTKQYDYAVYIGRFQPFHLGHLSVVKKALEVADQLIIVIGSAKHARNIRNPWTAPERAQMIRAALDEDAMYEVVTVRDHLYSDAMWVADVQRAVGEAIRFREQFSPNLHRPKVTMVGHLKDRTSLYLDQFPQWPLTHVPLFNHIHATQVRETYLTKGSNALDVPEPVREWLLGWEKAHPFYNHLKEEWKFVADYKDSWYDTPFPVQFNCVDSVVYRSGHVLLVKRGGWPGKGQWALPGGFVNEHERTLDAALRELKEETGILVEKSALLVGVQGSKTFDHPDRSLRGRTFSHAYFFNLGSGELPQIQGADDAVEARWWTLADIYQMEDMMFEDHVAIIEHFLVSGGGTVA
jgi:bifunctional NMN adenylyltransferase/nudix hydrolase